MPFNGEQNGTIEAGDEEGIDQNVLQKIKSDQTFFNVDIYLHPNFIENHGFRTEVESVQQEMDENGRQTDLRRGKLIRRV